MQALDAVTLTGNPQTITLPLNLPQATTLLFGNESAYAISVRIAGYQRWIHAWTADIVPIPKGANAILNLTPVLVGSNVNTPSATVLLSVADPGEQIPGTYPINLDRLTSLTGGVVQLTNSSVTISNSPNVSVINTPTVVANAGSGTMATSVTNTPAVTVSGTPNVAVTNTPAVTATISGTPAVSVSGTPNVAVTNTPTVVANVGTGTQPVSASNLGVSNATATQLAVNSPQTSLGSGSFTSTTITSSANYTLPTGTHAVLLIVSYHASNTAPTLYLSGSSGFLYINQSGFGGSGGTGTLTITETQSQIPSAYETTVKVTGNVGGVGQTVDYQVIAILDPTVVTVGGGTQPVPVYFAAQPSAALNYAAAGQAPWQAPTSFIDATRNTAGITALVAGVANKTVYVFGWWLQEDLGTTNSIGFLEDSSGARLAGIIAATGAGVTTGYHGGLALAVGRGLQMNAAIVGTGPANLRCSVSYSGPV